jgi:hypothetical protein
VPAPGRRSEDRIVIDDGHELAPMPSSALTWQTPSHIDLADHDVRWCGASEHNQPAGTPAHRGENIHVHH